jgi:hypothetical protein
MTQAPSPWRSTVVDSRCCCRSTPSRSRERRPRSCEGGALTRPWPLLDRWPARRVPGGRVRLRGPGPAGTKTRHPDASQRRRRPAGRGRCRRCRSVRLLRLLLAGACRAAACDPDRPARGAGDGRVPTDRRPYAQMLQVTTATHAMAMAGSASTPSTATTSQPSEEPSGEPDWSQVEVSLTEAQTCRSCAPGSSASWAGELAARRLTPEAAARHRSHASEWRGLRLPGGIAG